MRKELYCLFVVGLAITNGAFAADEETLVVTATRHPVRAATIGSSISLLSDEDLQKLSISYIDDALRTLPGVTVTQNGGPGGFSAVRIRGEESYRTLVLLDGVRIDDPAGTQIATNFANLLAPGIAQIEVVRGPQSLLYGADAIGGVVQILTKRPRDGFHYEAAVSGGAYETASASGALLYGTEAFGVSLSATQQQTQGFTAKTGDPDLGDADGHEVFTLHSVLRADPADALGLEAVLHYTDADAEFDGASAFPPFSPADPNRALKTREIDGRFAVTHHAFGDHIRTELSYARSSSRRDDLSDGLPFLFGSRFDGDRHTYGLLSTISLLEKHTFVIGAERERISATTDAIAEHSTKTGVFGEWEAELAPRLYVTAGLRYDEDDEFGSHVSGRATAAWLPALVPSEETRIHTSYGTGFRAPSPFERATNHAASLPELNEEQSNGYDFGVSQSFFENSATLDITYFNQAIDDEIRFDNVGFIGYFQALGTSRSRGLEVSGQARWPAQFMALSALELSSAYTFTDSTVNSPDPESGLPRVRRPRHVSASTLTLEFHDGGEAIALTLRTAAKAEDGFREFRVPLDSYAAFDVSARAKLTDNAEIFVRGVNLFNEQYQEVDGFATSDAAVYIGVRLRG